MKVLRAVLRAAVVLTFLVVTLVLLLAEPAAAQISVSSASPNSAAQGTVNLTVTVNGKGFKRGAQAQWFVSGTTNPGGVVVNSTAFVSSTQLSANITISDTAVIGGFDVQVMNADGRTGKGTELFAVQAKGSNTSACSASVQPTVFSSAVANPGFSCVPDSWLPGSLDSCFGTGGKVTTDVNGGASVGAIALQSDGKVVAAARAPSYPGASSSSDIYVVRYNSQGALDPTFGTSGVAKIAFTEACDQEGVAAIAIQPDGRIVLAGNGFSVARLNPDGSLDTTFAGTGRTSISIQKSPSGGAYGAADITFQSNGAIVLVGQSSNSFVFARLTPNGALDTSFNGSGTAIISTANSRDKYVGGGYAVAIQNVPVNGSYVEKIVAAGIRPSLNGVARDFAVMRLNPDGTLDSTFGSGGMTFTDFAGGGDQAYAIAVDTDNSIVVAGHANMPDKTMRFAVVRYTQNGQLSSGFGSDGKVTVIVPGYTYTASLQGVAIQSDGKIVGGGYVQNGDISGSLFGLARLNPDGSLDTSFGQAGIVTTDFSTTADYLLSNLVLQPDGKILAAGSAGFDGAGKAAIARYMP